MNYTIQNDILTVTVSSLGAELVSAVGEGGFEYIWQSPSSEWWGSHAPLLFPHCGRILNSEYVYNSIKYSMGAHGFAIRSEFALVEKTGDRLVLLLYSNERTKEIYPFDFKLTAEYKIEKDSLFVNFTVQNTGKCMLPYMLGWHPGFNLDCSNDAKISDFSVEFPGKRSVLWHPLQNGCFVSPVSKNYPLSGSGYQLDEEEIYKNDTMIFADTGCRAVLSSPKSERGVELSFSENLPYFCIWKTPDSRAKFICLEPWSDTPSDGEAPEDFATKRMSRLAPGGKEIYSYAIKFN